MKKYLILALLSLTGCQSFQPITFDQINAETAPNPHLLPALNLNINSFSKVVSPDDEGKWTTRFLSFIKSIRKAPPTDE